MTSVSRKFAASIVSVFALVVLAGPAQSAVGGTLEEIFSSGFESGNSAGWSDREPPECDDGLQDGDESDIDCGGLTCNGCPQGGGCFMDSDCADPAVAQAFPSCAGGACTMGCHGENYDVDTFVVDGCEVADSPLGNHTQGTGTNLGDRDCFDGTGTTLTFNGVVPSDARAHAFPPVGGFNSVTGSAPDHLFVHATGGFACVDDVSMTLNIGGSLNPTCYRLTVTTDLQMLTCGTSMAGTCTVSCGGGCYSDGSTMFFKVDKTCSLPVQESATYAVAGHL